MECKLRSTLESALRSSGRTCHDPKGYQSDAIRRGTGAFPLNDTDTSGAQPLLLRPTALPVAASSCHHPRHACQATLSPSRPSPSRPSPSRPSPARPLPLEATPPSGNERGKISSGNQLFELGPPSPPSGPPSGTPGPSPAAPAEPEPAEPAEPAAPPWPPPLLPAVGPLSGSEGLPDEPPPPPLPPPPAVLLGMTTSSSPHAT